MRLFALLVFLSAALPASASYRVYKLRLIHYDSKGKVEAVQTVLSNLDPYQYEHYYAGYGWMKIRMLDTWYCPGDTKNFRKYCKPPKVRERGLASFDHSKRALPSNRQPVVP